MLFVYTCLLIWLVIILFWIVTAKTDGKVTIVSELVPISKRIASPLLIYLPLITRGWFAVKLYPVSDWLSIMGSVVFASGAGLAMRARHALGPNWSGRVRLQSEQQIVESGPYRAIRHPIYFGGLLATMGSCLILGYAFSFAYFALSVFGLVRKSKQEEKLLASQLPDRYGHYKQRNKMLIPYVF